MDEFNKFLCEIRNELHQHLKTIGGERVDLYSGLLVVGGFQERIEEFANKTIEEVKAGLDYYIDKESVSKEDGEKVLELMMTYHVFKTYLEECHDKGFTKMMDDLFETQEEAKRWKNLKSC